MVIDVRVYRVTEHTCEDDDVFTFFKNALIDVVSEESANAGIFETVCCVEVSIKGLKD